MVNINLIKKRYTDPVERKERLLFLSGIFLPILLFSLAILSIIYSTNKTIIAEYAARMEKEGLILTKGQRSKFAPTEEEKSWQAELKKMVLFQKQHPLLAPKLVVLSDAIPNRFHLNRINFDGKNLSLEGQAPSGNQTMTSLAAFLEKLNGNENFTQGFNELRLEQVGEDAGTFNFRMAGTKK